MTNALIKAVASLTRCLRLSSFGAPAADVHVSRGLCTFREPKCSLWRNFRSMRKRERRARRGWSKFPRNPTIGPGWDESELVKALGRAAPADAAGRRFIASHSCPIGYRRAVLHGTKDNDCGTVTQKVSVRIYSRYERAIRSDIHGCYFVRAVFAFI